LTDGKKSGRNGVQGILKNYCFFVAEFKKPDDGQPTGAFF